MPKVKWKPGAETGTYLAFLPAMCTAHIERHKRQWRYQLRSAVFNQRDTPWFDCGSLMGLADAKAMANKAIVEGAWI